MADTQPILKIRDLDISFKTDGGNVKAVRGVDLDLHKGETIAIVGENGAGKSTLVRLLTGIYRPGSGRVLAGGLDTARYSPVSVFPETSGVFQKYQRYKMTLKENVAISDSMSEADPGRARAALEESWLLAEDT